MTDKIRDFVTTVKSGILTLSSTSEQLSATTRELSARMEEERNQMDQIATSTTEMSQSIIEIAKILYTLQSYLMKSSVLADGGKEISINAFEKISRTCRHNQRYGQDYRGTRRAVLKRSAI